MKEPSLAFKSESEPAVLGIPGIGISYLKPVNQLKKSPVFRQYCARAGLHDYIDTKPPTLEDHDLALQDNLYNQVLSYVVNCTMCDLYNERGIFPDLIIGYSMGLYAALYAGGYYSFGTGLSIVKEAYHLTQKYCSSTSKKYGMGILIGLKESEIRKQLFSEKRDKVDIAVYNGKRNFVIAGEKEGVDYCLRRASELGALGSRPILTKHPYHTMFLKNISREFSQFLGHLDYTTPRTNVFSLLDAKIIKRERVSESIVKAMYYPLLFSKVVNLVVDDYGAHNWYETGPAKSMSKLVRYINKKVTIFRLDEEISSMNIDLLETMKISGMFKS